MVRHGVVVCPLPEHAASRQHRREHEGGQTHDDEGVDNHLLVSQRLCENNDDFVGFKEVDGAAKYVYDSFCNQKSHLLNQERPAESNFVGRLTKHTLIT